MAKKKSDLPKNIYRLSSGHYFVQISIDNKRKSFGTYEKLDDAIAARDKVYKERGFILDPNHQRGTSIDLTGQKFGELTVLRKNGKRSMAKEVIWICECSCGKIIETSSTFLRSGHTKSCGHVQTSKLKKFNEKEHQAYKGTAPRRLTSENKINKNNTTGHRGVMKTKYGKFMVKVGFKRKVYYGGTYDTIEEAAEAQEALSKKLWGDTRKKYLESKNKK